MSFRPKDAAKCLLGLFVRAFDTTPVCAGKKAVCAKLDAGKTYSYCRCGRSKSQPFCDNSHILTPFTPLKFNAKATGDAWLCACKQTKNAPYCDGSHKSLK